MILTISKIKNKTSDPGYSGSGKNKLESLDYIYNIPNDITAINKDYALKIPGKYAKGRNFFGLCLGYDNRDGAIHKAIHAKTQLGPLTYLEIDEPERKIQWFRSYSILYH